MASDEIEDLGVSFDHERFDRYARIGGAVRMLPCSRASAGGFHASMRAVVDAGLGRLAPTQSANSTGTSTCFPEFRFPREA